MNTSRVKFILSLLVIAAAAMSAVAQTSDAVLRDKITNAVMKVYDEQLAKDPNDYNTLFARAHQHYYNGDYTSAITDVNQALLITPKTDADLRFDEYILRARISEARQDYTSELADLRMAQELQPKSLACTDMIAKANLKAGNINAAEKAFKTILRAESMNYDAMYGMAQVELARNNAKAAIEHVDKAVELFRVEPQVYVNRADIYTRLGNIDGAVADLLMGSSVGNGGNAVQRLFDLSDTNYDAVMRSLNDIADRSGDSGTMFRYLRGNLALDHNRYGQALRDFNLVRRTNQYSGAGLYYNLAKCCLELARFDEALDYADEAIARKPSDAESYVVKALAQYYAGNGNNYADAMETLNRCSLIAPQYVPMLMTKASLLMGQGKDKDALGYLNAAVANEPGNAEALLMRGLLLKKLDNLRVAVDDFNILSRLSNDPEDLKGLGLSELGRDNDALSWLQQITRTAQPGGENFICAALFMVLRGDNYKAMEYVQKAIDNGYGSLFNLQYDGLLPVSLKPLRNEPGFDLLIEKASPNFTEAN